MRLKRNHFLTESMSRTVPKKEKLLPRLVVLCSLLLLGSTSAQELPSDYPSLTPSTFPSDAPSLIPRNTIDCNICDAANLVITKPDASIVDPTTGERITCAELDARGASGLAFSPLQCEIVQVAAFTTCDCQEEVVRTTTPTKAPTVETTAAPSASLEGLVSMTMFNVAGPMSPEIEQAFNVQTTAFFSETLAPSAVTNVQATLQDQLFLSGGTVRRKLQSGLRPLDAFVRVTGEPENTTTTIDNFSQLLAETVNANPDLLIAYWRNATPAVNQIYFKSVENVTAEEATLRPTPAPVAVAPTAGDDESNNGGSANKLSAGIIAAIAVGSVVGFVLFLVAVRCYIRGGQHNEYPIPVQSGSGDTMGQPPPATAPVLKTQKIAATTSAMESEASVTSEEGIGPAETDAGDNMKYAYSLEPGNISNVSSTSAALRKVNAPPGRLGFVVDTKVEGPTVHQVNPGSPLEGLIFPGDVIVAIDNVDTRAMSTSGITTLMLKTAKQNRVLTVKSGRDFAPSPIPAPSQGSMLPAPSTEMSENDDASESSAEIGPVPTESTDMGSKDDYSSSSGAVRKVEAPPGKLGIVIDTALEGPVVHKVNPGSPLEGLLFPGDTIVAIDTVDTRAMSASAITSLMVKTANQKRVLSVRSGSSR